MRATKIFALVAMIIWIMLFSAGLLIDSSPYRQNIMRNGDFSTSNFIASILLYTPSNIALLSLLSGFLGGCSSSLMEPGINSDALRKARESGQEDLAKNLERRGNYLTESPFVSMIRGLLVYLGLISGILLFIADPFKSPTAEQFIRMAGLTSAIAFLMGYDPTRFEEMLAKFSQWKPPSA